MSTWKIINYVCLGNMRTLQFPQKKEKHENPAAFHESKEMKVHLQRNIRERVSNHIILFGTLKQLKCQIKLQYLEQQYHC
jgi:hypothetical protein